MRAILVASFIALSAATALPQEKLIETIEVRVVNVDVVVRDAKGHPVTGLTRDDFEVYDNKEKQEITNLYEVRADVSEQAAAPGGSEATNEPPAELRQRKLIVFVDNYSLMPSRRNEIFKSLERFVDEKMRPGDQTMLVLWHQQLQVVTPFTSDRNVLHRGIESLAGRSNAGFTNQQQIDNVKRRAYQLLDGAKAGVLTWEDAYASAQDGVDAYAEQIVHTSRNVLDALGRTTGALAGFDGKKVLVFVGAHLPEKPGSELYYWTYNLFWPFMKSLTPIQSMNGLVGSMQQYSIKEAAREASANGVTLYMIDAGDARDVISAENHIMNDESERFLTYTNTALAYQTLAKITGGVSITNTDSFDAAFRTIADDLNSYYSIGYKPGEGSDGERRRVVVRAKNPAYRVRAREMYMQKSSDEVMTDRVIANLYNSESRSEWPVEIHAGTPEKQGRNYRVPVEVSLAPTITLLPQENELVGGFTLYIAVANGVGAMSEVTRNPRRLRIPPEAEKQLRARPMTFSAVIMMSPGENTLSIGVVDQISSSAGFAKARVSAQ